MNMLMYSQECNKAIIKQPNINNNTKIITNTDYDDQDNGVQ